MEIKEYQKEIHTLDDMPVTIRIMTPDGYEETQKNYPVVYINDGQDVFYDKDIIWGECSMDYANYYASYKKFLPEMIIVALCCPEDRNLRTELYSPFVYEGGAASSGHSELHGKGKEYLAWLADSLKPWVDRTYRTISASDYTAIMGYSTGGLFAIYAALARPDTFSRFAALSSAVYIWMDELNTFFEQASFAHIKRIYMDVGTNEFGRITTKEEFLEGADILYQTYLKHGIMQDAIKYNLYPNAIHSQLEWKQRFPDALRWIFMDC